MDADRVWIALVRKHGTTCYKVVFVKANTLKNAVRLLGKRRYTVIYIQPLDGYISWMDEFPLHVVDEFVSICRGDVNEG